ncbi:MAG: TPM domain-containing protein, partial [Ruminococcus sp.]|nr:TPM domain-containing protein [Ruminococcus sp.]
KLITVAMEHGAANYVRAGSMNVTQSRDTYLYSTVTRTEKPKNNGGSSHSSGGGSYSGGSSNF